MHSRWCYHVCMHKCWNTTCSSYPRSCSSSNQGKAATILCIDELRLILLLPVARLGAWTYSWSDSYYTSNLRDTREHEGLDVWFRQKVSRTPSIGHCFGEWLFAKESWKDTIHKDAWWCWYMFKQGGSEWPIFKYWALSINTQTLSYGSVSIMMSLFFLFLDNEDLILLL